jgi:perosamine synthetase
MELILVQSERSTRRMEIPLSNPAIDERDIAAVLEVLHSTTLSIGPKVREFERAAASYVGVSSGVAVNSGTSGLHICLAASGIGPGDEVVTSPFSFVASANCILYTGATPVFADIDADTLNIDPGQVAAKITDRTRALIPVDVFGQPADIEAIVEIAATRDLTIIQDACEAIGAERNGHRVGGPNLARAAVFAFYPNKQMTTGEGGMIVTDDPCFAMTLQSYANQGRDDTGTWMNHVRLGYNYRMDEMSAALGVSQLSRLDEILDRRAQVAAWYAERLNAVPGVRTPYIDPATTRMSWFVYVIRLDETVDRPALMAALEADGVPTRPYFVPIHLQPYYRERFGYAPGDFPITERIARTTLAIPFFTNMTEDQVDYVCDRIAAFVCHS